MAILKAMIIGLFSLLGLFILSSLLIGYLLSGPGYVGNRSDHFNGEKFINPGNVEEKGFKDLIKWAMNRQPGSWEKKDAPPHHSFEIHNADSVVRVFFVNHSTFLIQIGNFNILTDPVWSERISPFQWVGPQRKRPPGINLEELPEIHLILISHNHYDHLDISTLKSLYHRFEPLVISPLGIPAFLKKRNINRIEEMDWWDESRINDDITIACVPAQHFSGRGMFDRDKTLWAGYVIKSDHGNIYFAGDTGYGEFFKQISQKYHPIKLAMLPIGAYLPRWFMSPIHISPEEAVQIHMELNAEKSVAIHFGAFPLGDDGMDQPIRDLIKARNKYQVENFYVLSEGESMLLE
jgi:L-ascorbate metabolism protein UlaG (beta-lactamase superfamily)